MKISTEIDSIALHIHDNDKLHDSHKPPFTMNIDFGPIVKALKEICYDGYFTLECSYYLNKKHKKKLQQEVDYLQSTAKKLADMFDSID